MFGLSARFSVDGTAERKFASKSNRDEARKGDGRREGPTSSDRVPRREEGFESKTFADGKLNGLFRVCVDEKPSIWQGASEHGAAYRRRRR